MPEAPPDKSTSGDAYDLLEVDLRNPLMAAVLSWAWPGAGHLYQRRYSKGVLFMVCVLGTYFFGLGLGGGKCVYASFTDTDFRWQYFFQAGVGLPALPAVVQNMAVMGENDPPLGDEFMAPPHPVLPMSQDKLAKWHAQLHTYFDLGTLYTMVAGLLNVMVICDALMGPALPHEDDRGADDESKAPPKSARRKKKRGAKT